MLILLQALPILEYGGIVWDNCRIQESDLLESVQLEAAHIITGLRKNVEGQIS
jgi:hypothetical protein